MTQLFMRRPTLDGLPPLPVLQEGFTLRPYREGDLDSLALMLHQAFGDPAWTPTRVCTALIDAPDVSQTLVIAYQGVPVATASARRRPEHPGSGYVHWVAADPAYQGLGLGYIVTLAVLHAFVEMDCRDAVLETDDSRLPAIRTYQKLGFRPEHRHETHPARWADVEAKLSGGTGP